MSIKTLNFSGSVDNIVSEVRDNIRNFVPSFAIYFASTDINQEELNKKLNDVLNCNLIGCSSHEEFINTKNTKKSVSIMIFDKETISNSLCVPVKDSSSAQDIEEGLQKFEKHFDKSIFDFDNNKYLGLVFSNNVDCRQDFFMDKLGDLSNLIFVGGVAGDDLKFKDTFTHCNKEVYEKGITILALIEVPRGYEVIRTQHFDINKTELLKVTKTSDDGKEIIELNNKKAIDEYCRVLNVKKGLSYEDIEKEFFAHPVGLVVGEDIFVKSATNITPNGGINFLAGFNIGNELNLLTATDIVAKTSEDLKVAINTIGKPSALLEICCVYRTLEIEAKHIEEQYGEIFKDIPRVGLSSYGEEYLCHVNQTSMLILFK